MRKWAWLNLNWVGITIDAARLAVCSSFQSSLLANWLLTVACVTVQTAARQFDRKLTHDGFSETVKKWLRYAPEREGGIPRNTSEMNTS
ncbi:hypothetical protein CgunFtcFv8_025770 [Champsocephalus gunnari]|uniref:Uncharacterized protein n=1 Tax=Champsocephalus gunnari TaxID=52237 RepID=A0AAN8H2Q9_CHAGU|nr:hypothetical protein CgunFtcFv8_025770 [Champsocephalus gunnari]